MTAINIKVGIINTYNLLTATLAKSRLSMKNQITLALFFCFVLFACEQQTPTESNINKVPAPIETVESVDVDTLADDAPPGRLPELAKPLHYELAMQIDPRQDRFTGELKLKVQLLKSTDGFWLHGQGLNVEKVRVLQAGDSSSASYTEVLPSGVAHVAFAGVMPAGEVTLVFKYAADFDTNLAGLFKVEEQGDFYALAKSESIQARKYLPGFDEPGYKAPFDISLTIPSDYKAIGNAPEVSRVSINGEYDKVTFDTTPPMPTYLLSLAVGPFDIVELAPIPANQYRNRPVPLRGFARRGKATELEYVMSITPRFVEIFETNLQQPYPFKKLDIVAAPQWPSGATELSGAITYREERLFLDADAGPGARLSLLGIHAHELAHMWFGNLVTPPWWDDLWLKEGFATWATPVVLSQFEPEGGHALNGQARNFTVMRTDSLASTRAIREPIELNDNIRNAYDGITYGKSQAVINMLDQFFGEAVFRPALGQYIAGFAQGVANSADFYQRIAKEMGSDDLQKVLQNFVEQPGVPILGVNVQCDTEEAANIQIKQQRYAPLGSDIDINQRWSIPVCISVAMPGSSEPVQYCQTMNEAQVSIALESNECPSWVMPNTGGHGYYRWQLASKDWQALLVQFDKLPAAEQLATIDSGLAAFEAGQLSLADIQELLNVALKATERQVVLGARASTRRYIQRVLPEQQAGELREYLKPLIMNRMASINDLDNPEQQLLQSGLIAWLATDLQDAESRDDLNAQAKQYLQLNGQSGSAKKLDSDLFVNAFSIGVQDNGIVFFDQLLNALTNIDDPLFAAAAPFALGSFKDSQISTKAYDLILAADSPLGSRERFDMLTAMLNTPELQIQHWNWVKAHLEEILLVIPEQWRRRAPRLANGFCDSQYRDELQDLFKTHGSSAPGHELALAQTTEAINLCVALREHVAQ